MRASAFDTDKEGALRPRIAPRFVHRRLDPDARLGLELTLYGAAAFLVVVPFSLLVLFVETRSSWLIGVDINVAADLHGFARAHQGFVSALRTVSALGAPRTFYVATAVVVVVLLMRSSRRLALWAGVTMAGAALLDVTVKTAVARARPHFGDPVAVAHGHSFPSGHALESLVGCGLLLLVALPVLRRGGRLLAGLAAVVVVALIGFSRVGLGVHYVSDVLAGWLLAVAWLCSTVAAFRVWQRRSGEPTEPLEEGLDPAGSAALTRRQPRVRLVPSGAARRLLAAAAMLLAAAAVLLAVMVGTGLFTVHVLAASGLGARDRALDATLAASRTPRWDGLTRAGSLLAATPTIVVLTAIAAAVAGLLWRRWREPMFILVAVIGEVLVFTTTTLLVHRPRPSLLAMDPAPPTSSFPSGHVAAATAFYGAVAMLVVLHARHQVVRAAAVTAAVMLAVIVALSRLYRGMHYPSDVVAGALLGMAWLWVTSTIIVGRRRPIGGAGP